MTFTSNHKFKTIDGKEITVGLRNTLRGDITYRVLKATFADDALPDSITRDNFAYFIARVEADSVVGTDWQPVGINATADEFTACYLDFADMVDENAAWECAKAVSDLKSRNDQIEKPDEQLTEDEQNNPKS